MSCLLHPAACDYSVAIPRYRGHTWVPEEAGRGEVELGEESGGNVRKSEPSLVGIEVETVLDPILRWLRVFDVVRTGGKEGDVEEVG